MTGLPVVFPLKSVPRSTGETPPEDLSSDTETALTMHAVLITTAPESEEAPMLEAAGHRTSEQWN